MKKTLKTVIITIGVLLICGFFLRGKISHKKFDSDKWKNSDLNSEENWSLRWDMMNSLRNNHDLVGMQKNEIVSLLGKPDDSTSGKENRIVYGLGYTHLGINTGALYINLNNKEIVTKISVIQG